MLSSIYISMKLSVCTIKTLSHIYYNQYSFILRITETVLYLLEKKTIYEHLLKKYFIDTLLLIVKC